MTGTIVYCNGRPATVEDLTGPALRNDGHFTTFQLRGRAVRGFELICNAWTRPRGSCSTPVWIPIACVRQSRLP